MRTKVAKATDGGASGKSEHVAAAHRGDGWCDRCRRDEDRPIYELMSLSGTKTYFRYMCGECAAQFTKRPLEKLLDAKRKQSEEARAKREKAD